MVAILRNARTTHLPICDIHILIATSPQRQGGCASGTDWAMSPMDKVHRNGGRTLAANNDTFFTPCTALTVATFAGHTEWP